MPLPHSASPRTSLASSIAPRWMPSVVDFMLAGAVAAAERAGLPTAALMHTLYCLPAPGRPPFGPGPQGSPWSGRPHRAMRRSWGSGDLTSRGALTDLNEARTTDWADSVSALPRTSSHDVARVLVLTSAAFDPPRRQYRPTCVTSDLSSMTCGVERLDLSWPGRNREPLVVVSFSTRFAAGRLGQRALDALGHALAVRGLLTLGPALAHDDLRVPANVLGPQLRAAPGGAPPRAARGHPRRFGHRHGGARPRRPARLRSAEERSV